MAKFRKKPVIVEAEQFDGTAKSAERLSLLRVKRVAGVWLHTGDTYHLAGASLRAYAGRNHLCQSWRLDHHRRERRAVSLQTGHFRRYV